MGSRLWALVRFVALEIAAYCIWAVLDTLRGVRESRPSPPIAASHTAHVHFAMPSVPVWAFVPIFAVGLLAAFWPTITTRPRHLRHVVWFLRESLRRKPETFRQEVFDLAGDLDWITRNTSNPMTDRDLERTTFDLVDFLSNRYHKIKHELYSLLGYTPRVEELYKAFPYGVENLHYIATLLRRLSMDVAPDVPARRFTNNKSVL